MRCLFTISKWMLATRFSQHPYLLQGMASMPCPLLQGLDCPSLYNPTIYLVLLYLRPPGFCIWFHSFPSPFPSPSSHGLAQDRVHSGPFQMSHSFIYNNFLLHHAYEQSCPLFSFLFIYFTHSLTENLYSASPLERSM